jgi:hypothetical protein
MAAGVGPPPPVLQPANVSAATTASTAPNIRAVDILFFTLIIGHALSLADT